MALGMLKKVGNAERKFGADPWYWFVKVQSDVGTEEYWLVTEEERWKLALRGQENPEDAPKRRRGGFTIVKNAGERHHREAFSYYGVNVREGAIRETWLLTDADLERIRQRTEKNAEDIEANRESWLADLLD